MIGQQKRTVDCNASLPPAKFYKHFDESNGKTSKCVVIQAEGTKRLVKHFSATPVQSFCKFLNRGQLASSILSPANCTRKSALLEPRGAVEGNSSEVTSKERGDVVSDGDKEMCIGEDNQECASIFQSYGVRNALTEEFKKMTSVGAQELQVPKTNNCTKPGCTSSVSRQDTLPDLECSGASNDSGDMFLNKSRVGKSKLCLEECQTSTEDVSQYDLGIKQESFVGGTDAGCTGRKIVPWDSKGEVKPFFLFNITQNEDSQSSIGMLEHNSLNRDHRQSMNLWRDFSAKSTSKDHCTLMKLPTQTCSKEWENVSLGATEDQDPGCGKTCLEGSENVSSGMTQGQDHECRNRNSKGPHTVELIQACNAPLRTSNVITVTAEPFLNLNKDLGAVGPKAYQYPSLCLFSSKEDLVAAKEAKEKQSIKCLEESHTSSRQGFEGRAPEHAMKSGLEAFWNVESPGHASVMEQSGPGYAFHGQKAYEGVEFEVQSNIETRYRRVPVGPEFQADLPQLVSASKNGGFHSGMDDQDSLRWLGEHIWSGSECELFSSEKVMSTIPSTVCSCPLRDSIQCVRLHVEEEREFLRKQLGRAFYDWGFDDMGEAASKNWTCDDKLTFQEVVRENPLSFWNALFAAFPAKDTRELVSYYFNVFVLRKRALQNRVNSWDIDSDDDEMVVNSEDEDSGSLFESDEEIYESNIEDATSENDEVNYFMSHADDCGDEENIQGNFGASKSSSMSVLDKHGLVNESSKSLSAQISWRAREEHVVKQSFDASDGARNQGSKIPMRAFDSLSWEPPNLCNSNQKEGKLELPQVTCLVSGRQKSGDCSACIVNSNQYVLDQCNSKVWDTPSLLPSMDVDKLISTKGMMEEFFGAES